MAEKLYVSESAEETERIAATLAKQLKKVDTLALYGEMGAGKTNFVRGLVCELMPENLRLVHSPTFAIVNEYRGAEYSIFHFDFYRIKDEEDLYSVAFFEYFDKNGIIITEWSELFDDLLPKNKKTVRIEKTTENGRNIYADFGD